MPPGIDTAPLGLSICNLFCGVSSFALASNRWRTSTYFRNISGGDLPEPWWKGFQIDDFGFGRYLRENPAGVSPNSPGSAQRHPGDRCRPIMKTLKGIYKMNDRVGSMSFMCKTRIRFALKRSGRFVIPFQGIEEKFLYARRPRVRLRDPGL